MSAPVPERRPSTNRHWLLPAVLASTLLLAACEAPRHWALSSAADALANASGTQEEDLVLVRDSAPVLLKSSEALLAQVPGHLGLAEATAAGFTQYAFAFVAMEADRLESTDARAAQLLRQRAARLYRRAHVHAMKALQLQHPDLLSALSQPPLLAQRSLKPALVPVAYWAAASWAAWISMSKNEPDVVADLPRAVALARWVHAHAPQHGQGAAAALLAQLEASRPGGSLQRAEELFREALAIAGEEDPAVCVAMAETLAQPAADRARFEQLLQRALRSEGKRLDLQSQVMHARARWLMSVAEDLF